MAANPDDHTPVADLAALGGADPAAALCAAYKRRVLHLAARDLTGIATVEEVAGWYVFLASDAARYATGVVIPLDGGLDAQQMSLRPITANERRV